MTTEPKPTDVGSATTAPGQTEVVAGTVEHSQVLSSFPNASSYGPDVNVIVPPSQEPEEPEAPASLSGAAHTTTVSGSAQAAPTTKGSKGSS
jgi:hypothetical protein